MSRGPAVAEKSVKAAAAPARIRSPAGPAPQPGLPEIGNLAMQDLLAGGLRAKLAIGGTDDPEEREADSVAKAVTSGSRAPCACGGTCEKCAGKASAGEGAIRRKPVEGRAASRASPSIAGAFAGPGRPIDMATRRHFEPRLGASLSHVRLHDDARTASMAATIGARAYAVGNHIGFARGQLSPNTPSGRSLLAHELAHVVMGHGGVRRDGMDDGLSDAEIEQQLEQARQMAAEDARHRAWESAVGKQWQADLPGQAKDLAEERGRLQLALSGLHAKAFDAAAAPDSWLTRQLNNAGYSGPSIAEVKQQWAQAIVAADAVKLSAEAKPGASETAVPGAIGADTKLAALSSIQSYYISAKTFSEAVEGALKSWADAENQAAEEQYRKDLEAYERTERAHKAVQGPIGEPGERAFRAGLALSRGPRPTAPTPVTIPPPISSAFAGHMDRVQVAKANAEWARVAADVQSSATALGKLMAASLPTRSPLQFQAAAIAGLEARLEKFADEHVVFKRIPAVFYPKDAGSTQMDSSGKEIIIPDSIPWQFYLSHRAKLDDSEGVGVNAGEWVLTDLTNAKAAENTWPSTNVDANMLLDGKWVDPPIDLFTPLNSKLRFPEGELYFTLPSGKHYVHHMTEPWSVSDWLSAAAMALAVAALVAGVVATGGAAAPAAIALGASIGSAAFGTAATLTELREKQEHGLLTEKDVDRAMIDIGLNVISVASLGLGKVVTAPGAAARFGSRFTALASTLRVLRYANLGGDLVQASLVTTDIVAGFSAINDNPQLTKEQKEKMIAQLARRALLTGAMMTIAIKGDFNEVSAGRNLNISHVEADGTPVAVKPSDTEAVAPKPHPDATPGAPHGKVTEEAHAAAEATGTGLTLAGNRHAIGVSGAGPTRDIYFCSDFCTTLTTRLAPIVEALKGHPMHDAFKDMLQQARKARADLAAGRITEEAANAQAKKISERITKLAADDKEGPTLQRLLDMDPQALDASVGEIRDAVRENLNIGEVIGAAEEKVLAMRQAQLAELFGDPHVNTHERGSKRATFGDPDVLPPYSVRPADKPYFTGDEGIPPNEGARMAETFRKLFKLPTTGDSTRNVAVAEAFIDGRRQLLSTVSGSEPRPGMVELPDKTRFRVVESGYQTRAEDTERKLLEYLADRLPPGATGTIRLYTERPACRSCAGVIRQFEQQFPGIKVLISFGGSAVAP